MDFFLVDVIYCRERQFSKRARRKRRRVQPEERRGASTDLCCSGFGLAPESGSDGKVSALWCGGKSAHQVSLQVEDIVR